ncbi:MAG: hypothetical protein IJU21_03720, partial [Bacteroidales bacterium]|nr:hypothetical protein [Bacteroidales bacterium]
LHGTEILDKLDGSGKYRRNAHIFSIQGIRRFNSALHQAPKRSRSFPGAFFLLSLQKSQIIFSK